MCVLEDIYKRHSTDDTSDTARRCLNIGKELLNNKEHLKALVYFSQASSYPQTAPEAFEYKMKTLFDMEDYKGAKKSISEALKAFPDNTSAYNYKALLYARDKKWDKAIACCDKIISIVPTQEDAYIAKSELLVNKGDFKRASRAAQIALAIYPESEKANFQAAKAFFGLKEYDKAIRFFGKVVTLNPKNAIAQNGHKDTLAAFKNSEKNELKLALTLLDNNLFADSLRHFENMLASGNKTAELYFFLGKAYKGLGDTPHMIESMQKAFSLAPYSTSPYIEIGEQLLSEGRDSDAMEYFERVLEIDPTNRIANIRKGEFLCREGMAVEAEEHFDRIINEDHSDAEAYLMKGITAIDRYPAAGNPMLYFDRAMEINPSYALPMYYRGKFQIMSGQKKRHALESFNKAAFLASAANDDELLKKCRDAISSIMEKE